MKILEVKGLKKTFKVGFLKKIEVLKWVNLSMWKWEVFWFLWPNWAGKTTTLKAILDFIKPTEWEIKIFWQELSKNRDILKKIWYAPEQAYYYDHLTWEEFLYYMWKLSWLSWDDLNNKVNNYLKKVGLEFARKKYIKAYSKWMKQRLGIASAIIHNPELVFFDEPMSWLDPLGRNLVKNIILELKQKWVSVFFNTHILSDVQEIADNFAIINKWEIIYYWKISDVSWNLEDFFVNQINSVDKNIQIK